MEKHKHRYFPDINNPFRHLVCEDCGRDIFITDEDMELAHYRLEKALERAIKSKNGGENV